MSKRSRLALSAFCALVAVVACLLYARHVRGQAERERAETLRRYGGDVVTLVVANRVIEAGETVAISDVDSVEWISSLAPEGALLSPDDVIGREVSVPVAAHAPLCELNFRETGSVADIPSGHVAVSVPVTDKLGITAAVAAGSHVLAYRAADGAAELIAQDAIVLCELGVSAQALGRQSLTIAVLPSDVAAILETSATGDLRLVVPAADVREIPAPDEHVSEVLPERDLAAERHPATSEESPADENPASHEDVAPSEPAAGNEGNVREETEDEQ